MSWSGAPPRGVLHPSAGGVAVRRGFSLIELLISLGVIAVLLGILLPALATSRARAGLLAFQVNQRECANIILLYTHDAAGLFPSYGVEKTMRATPLRKA